MGASIRQATRGICRGARGLLAISDDMSTLSAYQIIFLIFTTMYLLLNLPAIAAMAGWRVRRSRYLIHLSISIGFGGLPHEHPNAETSRRSRSWSRRR